VFAVRKIQASYVHSGADELRNHPWRFGGGAQSADDF
jgi:hypothetical protein